MQVVEGSRYSITRKGEQTIRGVLWFFGEDCTEKWFAWTDWSTVAHAMASFPDLEAIGVTAEGPEQEAAYTKYVQPCWDLLTHQRKITLANITFDS